MEQLSARDIDAFVILERELLEEIGERRDNARRPG
jgi:hypothetical protein